MRSSRRCAALLVTAACLGLLGGCGAPPEARPSIVLVTLDTVRCDHVGLYGGPPGLTPHLDALGAEGLVHEAAFTTMPTTGPAHISMFTGLYPSEHGSRENGQPMDPAHLPREAARLLGDQGYATAAFVTTRLLHSAATGLQGFEIHDAPRGVLRSGDEAVQEALRWLAAERRRPVFLWLHLYDAHAPYGGVDEKRRSFPVDRTLYGWVDRERMASGQKRQEMADRYAEGVRSADRALGALLDALPEQLHEPPLIIVTGDHGEALDEHLDTRGYAYDHGEFLDEDVLCVPMVLQGPGIAPGRTGAAVSVRDLYGTLLVSAGIATEPPHDARDLRRPGPERRLVAVERRRLGAAPVPAVRAHASAAFDGKRGVVASASTSEAPTGVSRELEELWNLAIEHAGREADRGGAPSVDPATARALESLGYVD